MGLLILGVDEEKGRACRMKSEPKRESWQLKQKQSLPLEAKIVLTNSLIREWYEHWDGQVCVSFSGGKDSTVLLDLVRKIYPEVEAVFADTGLEYPEIREFVKTFPNVHWVYPIKWDKATRKYVKTSFRDVVIEHGYPVIGKEISEHIKQARLGLKNNDGKYGFSIAALNGTLLRKNGELSRYNYPKYKYLLDAPFKISDACCDALKKNPLRVFQKSTKKFPYVGTMASESRLRETIWLATGCNGYSLSEPLSKPLSFWTEQDVLQYIRDNNLPYASIYGDIIAVKGKLKTTGAGRTGCVFCMFGVHLEKPPNKFQRLQRTHPRLYEYCMKPVEDGGLGLGKVLNFIGVPYKNTQIDLFEDKLGEG